MFLYLSFTILAFQSALSPDGLKDIYYSVVQNNVFLGQSESLIKYQSYELMYQLAHLYL